MGFAKLLCFLSSNESLILNNPIILDIYNQIFTNDYHNSQPIQKISVDKLLCELHYLED
jgi:hypothetical protein